jgi:hypothetical protein
MSTIRPDVHERFVRLLARAIDRANREYAGFAQERGEACGF